MREEAHQKVKRFHIPSGAPPDKRITKIREVGKGSYGTAFLVKDEISGKHYVLKEMSVQGVGDFKKLQNEVEILMTCGQGHPNVCKYHTSYMNHKRTKLYILMDYYSGGDLRSVINKFKDLNGPGAAPEYIPEATVIHYFVQLCLGLKHIHDRKILHRDLKASNVFVSRARRKNSNGVVGEKFNLLKIGDFGISTSLNGTNDFAKTRVGTPYYLSPEICQGRQYNNKSDIWSLGCILYELCSLKHAFDAKSINMLALKILRGQYPPLPSIYSKDLVDLVSSLLNQKPEERPSVDQILRLPFIKDKIQLFLSERRMKEEFSQSMVNYIRSPASASPCASPPMNNNYVHPNKNVGGGGGSGRNGRERSSMPVESQSQLHSIAAIRHDTVRKVRERNMSKYVHRKMDHIYNHYSPAPRSSQNQHSSYQSNHNGKNQDNNNNNDNDNNNNNNNNSNHNSNHTESGSKYGVVENKAGVGGMIGSAYDREMVYPRWKSHIGSKRGPVRPAYQLNTALSRRSDVSAGQESVIGDRKTAAEALSQAGPKHVSYRRSRYDAQEEVKCPSPLGEVSDGRDQDVHGPRNHHRHHSDNKNHKYSNNNNNNNNNNNSNNNSNNSNNNNNHHREERSEEIGRDRNRKDALESSGSGESQNGAEEEDISNMVGELELIATGREGDFKQKAKEYIREHRHIYSSHVASESPRKMKIDCRPLKDVSNNYPPRQMSPKFRLNNATVVLDNVSIDDPITVHIESLRLFLETNMNMDDLFSVYNLLEQDSADVDGTVRRITDLLGPHINYVPLIQQLLVCEEQIYSHQY